MFDSIMNFTFANRTTPQTQQCTVPESNKKKISQQKVHISFEKKL
jgi:hypothetical protein